MESCTAGIPDASFYPRLPLDAAVVRAETQCNKLSLGRRKRHDSNALRLLGPSGGLASDSGRAWHSGQPHGKSRLAVS